MLKKLSRFSMLLGIILSLCIGVYFVRDGLHKGNLENVILGGIGVALVVIATSLIILAERKDWW